MGLAANSRETETARKPAGKPDDASEGTAESDSTAPLETLSPSASVADSSALEEE